MIAISGIPGSGKTTLASTVVSRLNSLQQLEASSSQDPIATFVPMDGYHLTRAQLSALSDPATAHARRGAAFTFDGVSFLALVRKLRQAPPTTLSAPSFDHATKDPIANEIIIPASARILIFEGNYLSLNRDPWKQAADLMDELWFVEVDFEVARARLVKRHVKAGIAIDERDAHKRVTDNDLVNGTEIVENRMAVQQIIQSKEDIAWEPESFIQP